MVRNLKKKKEKKKKIFFFPFFLALFINNEISCNIYKILEGNNYFLTNYDDPICMIIDYHKFISLFS